MSIVWGGCELSPPPHRAKPDGAPHNPVWGGCEHSPPPQDPMTAPNGSVRECCATAARLTLHAAANLLHDACAHADKAHGARPPWASPSEAMAACAGKLADEPRGGVIAEEGGAVVGVGFVRRRGEAATIGPLASWPHGQGIGGEVLDELIARADAWSCGAVRLFNDGWNADSFALYAGRSFAAVDVVACVERPAGPPPKIDGARGLEVAAFRPADLAEAAALDLRLTGLFRERDISSRVRLVARRRGALVGFAGAEGGRLGPILALDVADLGALTARILVDTPGAAVARLSTAAPTAVLAALALGFRVTALGTVMVRGPAPTARPPQIYSLTPEIL